MVPRFFKSLWFVFLLALVFFAGVLITKSYYEERLHFVIEDYATLNVLHSLMIIREIDSEDLESVRKPLNLNLLQHLRYMRDYDSASSSRPEFLHSQIRALNGLSLAWDVNPPKNFFPRDTEAADIWDEENRELYKMLEWARMECKQKVELDCK